MKKLFVLFLLVALVPFTVGCSLWGGDDEAVTYPPTWTATVTVPAAGLSLRAATPTTYAGYTITINGVELPITDENGLVLTFSKVLTVASEVTAKTEFQTAGEVVTVTIKKADGTVVDTFSMKTIASTGTVTVNYTTGTPVVTVTTTTGTATVPAANIGTAGTYSITSVKVNGETLGATAAEYATATILFPAFTVTFPDAVTAADVTVANGLSITTKNAAGVTVAIAADDFTVAQDTANTIIVTVKDQAEPKRLNDGTVYSVTINGLKNADKLLAAAQTFWFKVVL